MAEKAKELMIQKIKNLLAEKKFKDAFKIYESLAQISPFDSKIIKIKKEILKTVERENREKIESALVKAKALLAESETEKALTLLKQYYKLAPNHKKLNKLIHSTQDTYRKEIMQKQKEFDEIHGKKLSTSMNKSVNEFLYDLINFQREYEDSVFANNFIERAKAYYIHNFLEKNKSVINSQKWDLIENIIIDLEKISDSNPEIKELEKNYKTLKYESQVQNLKDSIFEAEKNIETLLKMKKYQKAYQAIIELMKADNENQKAKEFMKIAKKGIFKTTKENCIKEILSNQTKLKEEYKKNPSSFKKI